MVLPEIINIDVAPAVIDETALNQRIRRALYLVGRNRVGKTVPTIPTHRWRQRNLVAADDAEIFLGYAFGIFCTQDDFVFAFVFN